LLYIKLLSELIYDVNIINHNIFIVYIILLPINFQSKIVCLYHFLIAVVTNATAAATATAAIAF